MTERTLSILKPDATERNLTGKINAMFESHGLRIIAQKRLRLSPAGADIYAVHSNRGFFHELVEYMVSGPVVVQVLEGKSAVSETARSWVQPTRKTPRPARSAGNTASPSSATCCARL